MKIGILLPHSKVEPGMGKSFIDAIHENVPGEYTFCIESIGFAENPERNASGYEKLVFQEKANVVIALLGEYGIEHLYEKAEALQVPLLVTTLGAKASNAVRNDYVFELSYGMVDAMSAIGNLCADRRWKKLGYSSSFNDAGYGFLRALEYSLYHFGGEFSAHYIPPNTPREDEPDFHNAFYNEAGESDVFCEVYNGLYAWENLEYWKRFKRKVDRPLIASPLQLNESYIDVVGDKVSELLTVSTWIPPDFAGLGERPNSAFALLGREVGLLLRDMDPDNILESIKGTGVEGPRGQISWKNQRYTGVHSLWRLSDAGNPVFEKVADLEVPDLKDDQESSSGWYNAYLCY